MRRSVHCARVIALVTFIVLLVTAGVRATPGVLMVPIEREFGRSRAADFFITRDRPEDLGLLPYGQRPGVVIPRHRVLAPLEASAPRCARERSGCSRERSSSAAPARTD